MNLLSGPGLLLVVTSIHCANILMVYETGRRSHQVWIETLANGLMDKGHNITMGGSFSTMLDKSDEYYPIRFEGVFLKHCQYKKTKHLHSTPLQKIHLNYKYNYAICKSTYHSKGFNSLWTYPKNFTFDIIIMDLTFGPCLYPLIQRFGNPTTVGFTPSALTPYLSDMFGNGRSPSYIVSPLLGPPTDTSFLTRVHNFLFTRMEILFKRTWEKRALENLAKSLLNETFTFSDLEKHISLLFVNEHPFLNEAQPLSPNIIPVGGMHLEPARNMTGVLHSVVNSANQGIIFFTLGTDIQQNIFKKKTKQVFANAFKRLVQKTVIWNKKVQVEDYELFLSKSENILLHQWMPQNDLLGHSNIRLLITTGGTLTIQEAISHGVPVVGMPIYDEHHRNIKFITDNKLGLKLDYNNLTEENIFETVSAVLQNPQYFENMRNMANKFINRPHNPHQQAVYWVEYVLNNTHGTDFLTPKSRNMSFFSAYSMDVEIFLFAVIITFFITLIIILKILLNFCFGLQKSKNVCKDEKKKK